MTTSCFELALGAGQGQAEGSYEYLVFNSTLLGVAAEHGLHSLTDWEDPELDECFDQACAHAEIFIWSTGRKVSEQGVTVRVEGEQGTPYADRCFVQFLLL